MNANGATCAFPVLPKSRVFPEFPAFLDSIFSPTTAISGQHETGECLLSAVEASLGPLSF